MQESYNNPLNPLIPEKELESIPGIGRTRAYQLLNRSDLPVIRIGRRKFMHRELFEKWLREQAASDQKNG